MHHQILLHTPKHMVLKIKQALQSDTIRSILFITALNLVIFWLVGSPRLLQDDWTLIIADGVFNRVGWFNWFHPRPLNNTFYNLLTITIGTNIAGYYWINFVLVSAIYSLVYRIADRLLPQFKPLALVAALLALVYPANYTTTWLTMINNHLTWMLALLGMWIVLVYILEDGTWLLVISSLLFFIPFWMYENALGITFAWCILLFFYPRHVPLKRRLALILPLFLMVAFAIFRVYLRPEMGIRGVNFQGFQAATPNLLLERLTSVKVLAQAWLGPLPQWLVERQVPVSRVWLQAGLIAGILMILLIVYFATRRPAIQETETFDRSSAVKTLPRALLIATGLVFAAMVPMVFVRPLNLVDTATRANLYAIPPAAVVIVCLLALVAGLLAKSTRQYRWLVWAGALPLVLTGLGIQFYVQARWQDAWEGQKAIWGQVFQTVSGIEEDTTVVLVMQGYRPESTSNPAFGTHPPIYAEWEFEDALKVLYKDPSLEGRIAFPRTDYYSEAAFTEQGVQGANRSELTPYDRVIFLIYRQFLGQLDVLENPVRLLGLHFELPGYAPYDRILPADPSSCQYRHLVGLQGCDSTSTR